MPIVAGDLGHLTVHNTLNDAWTSFTPSTIGFSWASPYARHKQVGKTVHLAVVAATTGWSGAFTLTLPVAAAVAGSGRSIGTIYAEDVSTGLLYVGIARLTASSSTAVQFIAASATGTNTSLSSTAPFTWATGDILSIQLTYEAA